jgi:hypothetical protein
MKKIKPIITVLSLVFVVKDLGPINTFVGCKIIENKEKDTIWIHQPKLIKNLEEQFGPLVAGIQTYKTPEAPSTNIQRPKKGEILISSEEQTKFRSGVGMLLYLVQTFKTKYSKCSPRAIKRSRWSNKGSLEQIVESHQVYSRYKTSSIEDEIRMGSTHQNGQW